MSHDENEINDANDSKWTKRLDGLVEDLDLAEKKALEHQLKTDKPLEPVVPWVIELRVIGTPNIIRVPLGQRLMLGRDDVRKDIYPDIDLSPYNAQSLGVSRKHARLKMQDNRLTIEDLNSANGTYVNGRRVDIIPTRIRDGDQIRFGNLALQVHFVIQPHSDEDTLHGFEENLDIPKIGSGQRLLVLDDNKEVCAVVRMIAMKAGFQVFVSHTTQQALSLIDSGNIDGIFVELMLEENNGLDVVDYVRQHTSNRIPIVATTSGAGGYREGQALAKGVDILIDRKSVV